MYYWITLLYIWNYHNAINQLYSNKIKKKKNQSSSQMPPVPKWLIPINCYIILLLFLVS